MVSATYCFIETIGWLFHGDVISCTKCVIVHLDRSNASSFSIYRRWQEFQLGSLEYKKKIMVAPLLCWPLLERSWRRKNDTGMYDIQRDARAYTRKKRKIICRVLWASIKFNPTLDRVCGMFLRTKK